MLSNEVYSISHLVSSLGAKTATWGPFSGNKSVKLQNFEEKIENMYLVLPVFEIKFI